jgi:ElaB/YqjD/DUF883 family membrane-anchored ribosome-binding protein
MKATLTILTGLVLVSGMALGQGGPGPGPGGSTNGYSHSWSNYVNQVRENNYLWGTNHMALTNAPKAWNNSYKHSYSSPGANGSQAQNRLGKPELPADVQGIVQTFERDRTQLMSQLKTCSDEQRQELLKEMEQLRTQLREQIGQLREQAQQQAEQMRNRFGNNRDRVLDQGAGTATGGRDRGN